MNAFGVSLLAFLVAIGVLVAVHEFGHFWVARRLGVKVLRFSIGFGKPIYQRRFGADATEFAVGFLPLGGYVKMLDEREAPVAEPERHRAFNRKPLWVRSSVICAGPLFNFLFAILAYWVMFVSGVPGLKPVLGDIEPRSPAAEAGLLHGDELLAIDGRPTPIWDTATLELLDAALARDEVDLLVRGEDGEQRLLTLDFGSVDNILDKRGLLKNLGLSVWRPSLPAIIERVVEDSPAEQAGLGAGDRILAVDGNPVPDWSAWVDYVRARPGQALQVRVQRGDGEVDLQLVPRAAQDAEGNEIGQIGAYVQPPDPADHPTRTEIRYGPLEATGKSALKTWEMSALTLRTLWGMLSGHASVENISGPISIAQYAGYSASIGMASFLKFLAIVSISLGVLNLLPIPILDGGHLLYNLIEWVRGKPLTEQTMQVGQQLGIVLLLLLMGVAFYNDLSRLFGT